MWVQRSQSTTGAVGAVLRLGKSRLVMALLFAGFSVFMFLLGAYYHKKGSIYGVQDMIRQNYRVPINWIRGQTARPPRLVIDVKHKHYQKLAYNRSVALERGGLLPDVRDEVPALLRLEDRIVRTKLRLKGDLPDHWRDEHKWSFRIRIRGDDTLFGMKEFSIQHPRTRDFLTEWFLHRTLASEGLIGLRYEFVNVTVNGRDLGLYAVEEHFEKRLIEYNRNREGPLFRANTWFYWYHDPGLAKSVYGTAIDAYQTKQLAENPALARQFRIARNLFEAFREGDLETHEVMDVEKFAVFFAVLDLMGHGHAGALDNMAFYYNPVTSLIEPVAADTGLHPLEHLLGADRRVGPEADEGRTAPADWFDVLFRDPRFFEAYVRAVDRVSRPEYLDEFFAAHEEDYRKKLRTLHQDFPWYSFEPDIEVLRANQRLMRAYLAPAKSVQAYWKSADPETRTLELELGTIVSMPVELTGVSLPGDAFALPGEILFVPVEKTVLQPYPGEGPPRYRTVAFRVAPELAALTAIPPEAEWTEAVLSELEVKARVLGSPVPLTDAVHPWPHRDPGFLADDFLRQPPNFETFDFLHTEGGQILVARGDHVVARPLVIPPGFTVVAGPGTRLDLVAGAKILSFSPFQFRGSPEEPIVIESSDSAGQGLALVRAGGPSVLEHVRFENLDRPEHSGWELTGAVTFFESPVSLLHCEFVASRSEDALNVIRGEFLIEESVFERTAADALDVDFGHGRIVRSAFLDCGNDGVDVSGTTLDLEDVMVDGSGDKAVSAGEASSMTGRRVTVRNAAIAVSSKDLSKIAFETLEITDSRVGLAIFRKKPEFGPGSMTATGVALTRVEVPYLIDATSSCTLNGEVLAPTHDNVEALLYGAQYGKASR